MNDKTRVFAIANWIKDREENVENNILSKLHARPEDKVLIYVNAENYDQQKIENKVEEIKTKFNLDVQYVSTTKETNGKNRATFKNFILKDLAEKFITETDFPWFYMIEDNLEFVKDPSVFYNDIESLIDFLDFGVWFNTITDVCNLVFDKYDPRSNIIIDVPKYKKVFDKTICWCSHSNPAFFIVNTKNEPKENLINGLFDDSFYIPMFWIIKYLAERSNNYKGKYFMNFYPTIESERGVFKKISGLVDEQVSRQLFIEEDKKFKECKVQINPCTDVQFALDFMYDQFKKKGVN